MNDITFNKNLIMIKLSQLNVNKSSGLDNIPCSLLRNCADTFAPILVKFFQKSYDTGIVPNKMKQANVVPIFKGGDRTSPSNHRPVSLTPVIAKLFEGIIHDGLTDHIKQNSSISDRQHGFMKGRSTNSNLIQFCDDLSVLANDKTEISIVYIDLRKAFDSVPHDLLLY